MEENTQEDQFPKRASLTQVDEKCAECGVAITELPFTPRPGSAVYCLPCHKERRGPRREMGGGGVPPKPVE